MMDETAGAGCWRHLHRNWILLDDDVSSMLYAGGENGDSNNPSNHVRAAVRMIALRLRRLIAIAATALDGGGGPSKKL